MGVTINRPPRDGRMAFVRSPDGISIELLQEGARCAPPSLGVDAQHRRVVELKGHGEYHAPLNDDIGAEDRRFGAEDGAPRYSIQKWGFQVTSQRKPSGSAK